MVTQDRKQKKPLKKADNNLVRFFLTNKPQVQIWICKQ